MKYDFITIPEQSDKITVSINEGRNLIAFVEIIEDQCREHPCENDEGMGNIYSLISDHMNYNREIFEEKANNPDCVQLSYSEHGLCLWQVGEGDGIWVPNECVLDSVPDGLDAQGRRSWLVEQAQWACEVYTSFFNGEVYGYSIHVYALRRNNKHIFDFLSDYRFDKAEYEDSCFGFYGLDEVIVGIKESLS